MRIRRLAVSLFPTCLLPTGIGLGAFAVYLQTLLPGVGWGDIARFQYVARVWGIPHRFGYPLYVLFSRVFGYLPLNWLSGHGPGAVVGRGTAYRLNLMSAVFAALAAVVVYFVVMRLANDWIAASSAGLSYAFSRALWGQAVVAEVYTLNAFLIGVVVLVLLAWHEASAGISGSRADGPRGSGRQSDGRRGNWGLLYLGIGLYALSFGNHMTVVTLLPAVVYLLLVTDYRMFLDLKKVAIMAGLMLLGAAQYLYVIIRAHQQPVLNELGPFSWGAWIHWMTRNRFPGQFFRYPLGDQVDRMRIYLELLEKQFFRWGYILGWIGIWERLKTQLKSTVFLALVGLGIYAFGMNYGGVTFRIYLIPSYLVFAIFLGCGLSAIRRWLADLLRYRPPWLARSVVVFMAAVILILPLYPLRQNWAEVDQSDNTYYQDMARNFVERVESDFVLVQAESHYDELEAILYMAWAEKDWFDARSVTPAGIDPWLDTHPVYCWYGDPDIDPRYIQESERELSGMARIVGIRQG